MGPITPKVDNADDKVFDGEDPGKAIYMILSKNKSFIVTLNGPFTN